MLITPTAAVARTWSQVLAGISQTNPVPIDSADFDLTPVRTMGLEPVPVTPSLEALENRVIERLVANVGPDDSNGETPRVLLFGPGASRSDPLYALRFVAKLSEAVGRRCALTVYDSRPMPWIEAYYRNLPWNGTSVDLILGRGGDFEKLRNGAAQLILSIHPGADHMSLLQSFAGNLVSGGLAVTQCSVIPEFSDGTYYDLYLDMLCENFEGSLALAERPVREHVFRSAFADRSGDVHAMTWERKGL